MRIVKDNLLSILFLQHTPLFQKMDQKIQGLVKRMSYS